MDMDSNYTADYYSDEVNSREEVFCDQEDNNVFGAKLSVFFYLIFILSLLGNSLVLLILCKFEKITTVTNILLVNLVASGLLFMLSLPFLGVYHQLSTWVFGWVACKLVGSTYNLGFYSSILFLTLMTFDRFLAVVHSLEAQRIRRRGYAVAACAGVWLVSVLSCVKDLLVIDVMDVNGGESKLCGKVDESDWLDVLLLDQWELYIQLVVFFLFPLWVIVYCYARIAITVLSCRVGSKFRTVRLIFIMVLLFFICWAPYNVVLLLNSLEKSCEQSKRLGYALHLTRHLTYLYFCISPMFYTFVGRKFQNHFRLRLVTWMPCLREHIRVSRCSKRSSRIRKMEGRDLGTDRTNDS